MKKSANTHQIELNRRKEAVAKNPDSPDAHFKLGTALIQVGFLSEGQASLEKALELLRTTDLNVSEVAYDTGFKNPSHFSRAFSSRYGYAPSEARRENPTFV